MAEESKRRSNTVEPITRFHQSLRMIQPARGLVVARTFLAALLLYILLLSVVAAQTTIPARLEAKEAQLEQLYAEYWRTEYQIALGKDQLSSRPIQERIRAVVGDEQFLQALKHAHMRSSLLRRRRDLFLDEATFTKISNDPKLTQVVESITREENAIRYRIGDQELTRAELSNILGHNPDRQQRRAAWQARAQITAPNGERIRRAMVLRNQLAVRYSDVPFSTFMLRRKGVEIEKLFAWFEQIRSETDPEYQQLLKRIRTRLQIGKVEPWDLDFYFSTLTNNFEDELFAPEKGWARARQIALGLGYDLNKLPIEMRVADLSFAGAAYPILYGKEVKILANRYRGIRFYDRLLHATGHAIHYTMMDEPSFLLRANYAEPFDEGVAQLPALMMYRPETATRVFGLTREQAQAIGEQYRFKEMYDLRETMADALFEFEAYAEPAQDLNALYNRIHSQYLGVDMHGQPVWAYNPLYGSDPIYLQSYVVGEIIARQIEHTLDQRFGHNWGWDAGSYLRSHFYSCGARLSVDQLMKQGTGEQLTAKYLIESIRMPPVIPHGFAELHFQSPQDHRSSSSQ